MKIKDIAPNFWVLEEVETGRYDVNSDRRKPMKGDTRKPKLTLRGINKLKKLRATKEMEMVNKQELMSTMYGLPDESSDMA